MVHHFTKLGSGEYYLEELEEEECPKQSKIQDKKKEKQRKASIAIIQGTADVNL